MNAKFGNADDIFIEVEIGQQFSLGRNKGYDSCRGKIDGNEISQLIEKRLAFHDEIKGIIGERQKKTHRAHKEKTLSVKTL